MSREGDRESMLTKTSSLISRVERRVQCEQELAARAEREGRDSTLTRNVLSVLVDWLSLLVDRRTILRQWLRRRR